MNSDPYFNQLLMKQKQLEATSFLVQNQVRDLQEIARKANGKWLKTVENEINLIIALNNESVGFAEDSIRIHLLQQFRITTLEELVQGYSSQDNQQLIHIIKTAIKKCQK
jgi:hypothetical protein